MGYNHSPTKDELRSEYDFRTMHMVARGVGRTALSASRRQEVNPSMKEVRLQVTLTNAGDEALVRRGLLPADKIRHYEADALVDTGTFRSVLPIHVVQRLGLAIVRKTRATHPSHEAEDIDITEAVGIDINGRRTTEETLVLGSEVLIGQTVIASLDLLVDFTNHRVIPNPEHPDQPMIKIKWILEGNPMSRGAVHA
jgi:predicted aspartyl protease